MLTKEVWKLSAQDYPDTSPIDIRLRFLLRYAILAPSVRNTQPWSFAVEENTVRLFAAGERALSVADPERRELYISLGCALENLLVAAERFGFRHEVALCPDPGDERLAATVTFHTGGGVSPGRAGITLGAIAERHNDNSVYRAEPVPWAARERLAACRMEPELTLQLTDDVLFRHWIERLTLDADRTAFADPAYRAELAYWISLGVLREPGLMARIGGWAVSRMDLGESVAEQDHRIVDSAALLGLISAPDDTHASHIRTGQLFERVWLKATVLGLNVHPMSQTMRHPQLRGWVADLAPEGMTPQHLFRIGYSSRREARHTPRLPLDEVLGPGGP